MESVGGGDTQPSRGSEPREGYVGRITRFRLRLGGIPVVGWMDLCQAGASGFSEQEKHESSPSLPNGNWVAVWGCVVADGVPRGGEVAGGEAHGYGSIYCDIDAIPIA